MKCMQGVECMQVSVACITQVKAALTQLSSHQLVKHCWLLHADAHLPNTRCKQVYAAEHTERRPPRLSGQH